MRAANVRCCQTARRTKVCHLVWREASAQLGDFVFDGDPALPKKKAQPHTEFLADV